MARKPKKKHILIPPTLKEAEDYVKLRNLSVNPKEFIEHYEDANPPWYKKNDEPVINWKHTMRAWHNRNIQRGKLPKCWCGKNGVYIAGYDNAGFPTWRCIDHKPQSKPALPKEMTANVFKSVPQDDKRSTSDKVNEQTIKLKG
jgi:hypothetical protein